MVTDRLILIGESLAFAKAVNRGVEILRIILLDPSFNAGGIIACHVCKIRIDVLTDRFSESTRRSKTT